MLSERYYKDLYVNRHACRSFLYNGAYYRIEDFGYLRRHVAILEYLETVDEGKRFADAAAAFRREASLSDTPKPKAAGRTSQLARKWTTLLKLQAKVLQLEQYVRAGGAASARVAPSALTRLDFRPVEPVASRLRMHRRPVTGIALHPTMPLAVSSSADSTAIVWDIAAGTFERSLRGHTAEVLDVTIDPTGSTVATSSADRSIKLWQMDTLGASKAAGHPSAAATADSVRAQRPRRTLAGHTQAVTSVCFCSIPKHLVAPEDAAGDDFREGEGEAVSPGARSSAGAGAGAGAGAAESRGGARAEDQYRVTVLVSASRDCCLRLWDTSAGTCLATVRAHSEAVLRVRSGGSVGGAGLLVAGSLDHTASVFSAAGLLRASIEGGGGDFEDEEDEEDEEEGIGKTRGAAAANGTGSGLFGPRGYWVDDEDQSIVFPGGASTAASAREGEPGAPGGIAGQLRAASTRVEDGAAVPSGGGVLLARLGHGHAVEDVAIIPSSGEAVAGLHRSIRAAARVLSAGLPTGDKGAATGGAAGPGDGVSELQLPPVERCGFIATCSRDGSARVWTVELPAVTSHRAGAVPAPGGAACIATVRAGTGWLRGIAFHPSGGLVVSVGEDGALRLFDAARGRRKEQIEGAMGPSGSGPGEGRCVAIAGGAGGRGGQHAKYLVGTAAGEVILWDGR